jgi:RHS repeat-associated protein
MYRFYSLIFLLGYAFTLSAQNRPDPASIRPAASAQPTPVPYTNTTINYIRTWEPSMPTSDPAAVTAATDVNAVRQTTQYFDGLGRPLQTVSKSITPGIKDLVVPVLYDAFGREQYKYLPYVPKTGNTNDGKFKIDPFNGQQAFYQDINLAPGAAGESVYYSNTDYEASPLNRPLKSYAPGNTWAKEGGNKPVEQQYRVNTPADGVRIWDLPANGSLIPTSVANRVYLPGQLYKNVTIDEHGKRVIEYKDKDDRVILKKMELTDNAADGHAGWLCTYYVYDDLGNLTCVIPPKAVAQISANWIIDPATGRELCFFYRYDNRNRMIVKKLPGADSTEMVYDTRDRLAFSRDGNMKVKNQWLLTFYDALDRPIMTALYNSAAGRTALQTSMNNAAAGTQTITYMLPAQADLVFAYHDGRPLYTARNNITFEHGFDTGTGATLAEINSAANQDTLSIAAVNPLPGIPSSALTPLTYTFYDNYNYSGKHNAVTGDFTAPQYAGSPYAEVITAVSTLTKGLVTGTKVRVLGTDQWLTTTTYYTDKGRVLQTISDNIGGGKEVLSSLYDFSGKLLSTFLRHTNLRSGTVPQTTVMTQQLYDAAGRVTDVIKQLNGGVKRTIAKNSYDELGQLKTKRLHAIDATQLETLNYEYNIRGWLRSINKGYIAAPATYTSWFTQELNYDYGFRDKQLNGNIAGTKWKSRSDGKGRAYGFSYDNASRLTIADFTQNNTGANWDKTMHDFSVNGLSYDANGNIQFMTQRGMNGTSIQVIDSLKYGYQLNSNKLSFVTDRRNNTQSQLGDFKEINNNETADYAYDSSGNMIRDLNKNITAIAYNHLNLPELITITGKGTIRYQYDAVGNKVRKVVTDNSAATTRITTTDYMGGMVYRNDTLELIGHEEGRIRPVFAAGQPVKYYYDYFVKDHLGNTRMVLTEQTDFTMYAATMETANAAKEAALFSNVEETRAAKPTGYPQDQTTNSNEFVAKLNAKEGGKKIGPSLVLRVMAGDTVQIGARAFYKSTGPKDKSNVTPEDMVASLLEAFGGGDGAEGIHTRQADRITPFGNFNANDYQRLKEKGPNQQQVDKPKAYLNFVLFDDQFNLVEENSGVRQVKAEPDQLQTLAVDKMAVTKSGFLYVYTSNETAQDVLFDNVTVAEINGPLLEETHYYPFGLTMAGISSNALKGMNYPENRKKYNGIEFTKDLDLDIYDAQLRNLDPQIGRWNQVDPKTDKMEMWSPYASNYDNPIRYNDFLGDEPEDGGPGPSFIPVPGADFLSAMNETAKDVGNAIGNFLGDVGVSLGGIINGMNQSSTFGTYPSVSADQFGFNPQQTALYNTSTTVGQYAPSLSPGGRAGESPAMATVNGKPISSPLTVNAPAVPGNQANASLKDQASKVKNEQNNGQNSVTIRTPNKQIRFDLAGKDHGPVPTPHKQVYNKNFFNGILKSITRASKEAESMTQQEVRLVRKYLEKLNKSNTQ